MENLSQNRIKILILGDSGVGKTTLLNLICENENKNDSWTLGCKVEVKLHDYRSVNIEETYALEFWDIGGCRQYESIRGSFYIGPASTRDPRLFDLALSRGSTFYSPPADSLSAISPHAILLVYDLTNRKTFMHLDRWLDEVASVLVTRFQATSSDMVFPSKSAGNSESGAARLVSPISALRHRTPPSPALDECRIPVLLAGCRADLFDRHRHLHKYRPPQASSPSGSAQSAALLQSVAPPPAQSAAPTAPGSRLTASTVTTLRRLRPSLRNLHIDSDTPLASASASASKASLRNGSSGQISFYLLDEIFVNATDTKTFSPGSSCSMSLARFLDAAVERARSGLESSKPESAVPSSLRATPSARKSGSPSRSSALGTSLGSIASSIGRALFSTARPTARDTRDATGEPMISVSTRAGRDEPDASSSAGRSNVETGGGGSLGLDTDGALGARMPRRANNTASPAASSFAGGMPFSENESPSDWMRSHSLFGTNAAPLPTDDEPDIPILSANHFIAPSAQSKFERPLQFRR